METFLNVVLKIQYFNNSHNSNNFLEFFLGFTQQNKLQLKAPPKKATKLQKLRRKAWLYSYPSMEPQVVMDE
jgi:hypothetical protein